MSTAPQSRRPARPPRRPGHGRAAAGQVIVVGLVCFSLWLLLDARELYHEAGAGPIGTRRSVAMSVLRPIARVGEGLSLDRIENGAERALGRVPTSTPVALGDRASGATERTRPSTTATSTPGAAASGPPATLVPLSAAHPLTLLVVGDSIGEDLGIGLTDVVGANPTIHVIDAATTDTGLADPAYFNWPATLARLLAVDHPDIVVAMMGGNDWQPFIAAPGRAAIPGTAYWRAEYGSRVAKIITEATTAGAKVFWVGPPIMGPDSGLPADMAPSLDAVDAAESDALGATYIPSWNLFVNGEGDYAEKGVSI